MEIALLNDDKTIKDLVEVDIYTKTLKFIEKELKADEYNFVVTADNLAFAKTKMADLNKSIKFIDTFRKDKVSAESADIDLFKVNIKDYIAPIDLKREEIKKNVEVFERETKDNILKELSLYSGELIKSHNIRDNFIDVDIIDLIVLGSVTPKGALTKKAKDAVESRVMICKSKQDKYDMRLLKLENASYEAGLETPLTITHIQGIILLDDDEVYETKLKELISAEIERQNTIKANLQEQANKDAQLRAQQNVLNEQNRIKKLFTPDLTHISVEGVDYFINMYQNYDFMEFNDFRDFAYQYAEEEIAKLENIKKGLLLEQQNAKPEVETVEETIPFTQDERTAIVNENKNAPVVEDNKKIVRVQAIFEVIVPSHINPAAVLKKVNSRLIESGISEDTLKSLEVV